MRKLGFRIITIIDPGVKKDNHDYKIYQEGIEKGYFVKAPDGTVYVNQVWPGMLSFQTSVVKKSANGGLRIASTWLTWVLLVSGMI